MEENSDKIDVKTSKKNKFKVFLVGCYSAILSVILISLLIILWPHQSFNINSFPKILSQEQYDRVFKSLVSEKDKIFLNKIYKEDVSIDINQISKQEMERLVEIFNNNFYTKRILFIENISIEKLYMIIVLIAGALGSLILALRSFTKYVGTGNFDGSWTWWYLIKPFMGALLGLIFYFLIKSGILTNQNTALDINIYGIVVVSIIAGMFTDQAIIKLEQIFGTLINKNSNKVSNEQKKDDDPNSH
ncbi:MAG: hypothetical protein A2086_02665 [Spirochaetes bacterium GWD1_27_9]|nr:MAG: hypothetical protein A2Y34_02990 [Spirochaetes bacterium GWC1_27_15]OHD31529.1 MAG: hypothetical protein A2086_02665 [Spirochaetes bacterium GWD1_27_9]